MKYTTQSCGFRFVFLWSLCRLSRAFSPIFFCVVCVRLFLYYFLLTSQFNKKTNDMWIWNILSRARYTEGTNRKEFEFFFLLLLQSNMFCFSNNRTEKKNFNSIQMFWGSIHTPCPMCSHVFTCLSHIFRFFCVVLFGILFFLISHQQIDIFDDTTATSHNS